jgi:hypothetical protein
MLTFKMVHEEQLYVNVPTKPYYLSGRRSSDQSTAHVQPFSTMEVAPTFLDNKHHMNPNQSTKHLYSKIGCRKEKKWKEGNHGGVASGVRSKQTG